MDGPASRSVLNKVQTENQAPALETSEIPQAFPLLQLLVEVSESLGAETLQNRCLTR